MCASDLRAHSIIIYDYNEEEDELYCNYGWGSGTNHVALSSMKYQYFEGTVTLNFNSEHSHSNNYIDSDGNAYCSCYFSCHPEHVCTYAPCEDDDSKHMYTCNCQYKTDNTGDHSLMYVSKGASYHIQRCTVCGWTSETEAHYWKSSDFGDSVECKFCGYLKRLNGGFIPIIKSKKTDIKEIFAYAEVE